MEVNKYFIKMLILSVGMPVLSVNCYSDNEGIDSKSFRILGFDLYEILPTKYIRQKREDSEGRFSLNLISLKELTLSTGAHSNE